MFCQSEGRRDARHPEAPPKDMNPRGLAAGAPVARDPAYHQYAPSRDRTFRHKLKPSNKPVIMDNSFDYIADLFNDIQSSVEEALSALHRERQSREDGTHIETRGALTEALTNAEEGCAFARARGGEDPESPGEPEARATESTTVIEVQNTRVPSGEKAGKALMEALFALNEALQSEYAFFVTAVLVDGRTYHGTISGEAPFRIEGGSASYGVSPEGESLPAKLDVGDIRHLKVTTG